jgi:O-antigen/teichoic acid export membrane protein
LSFSLKYFLSLAIPASFGLSILSRQLLLILSTQEIADAAYSITPIIVLSMFLYGVSYFFCQIMILTKKTNLIAIICAAGAFLNIILNIMFIPKFGILAASLTTLVSYVCIFSLTWYFAFKEFQFKIEWGFIIKSVLSSLVMVLFIFLLNPKGLLDVILSVILGVLIYIILIFLFKGFGRKEIIFLKNFIKYEMVLFNK